MPHAALCVSRQIRFGLITIRQTSFNAARSIVCVETKVVFVSKAVRRRFNAARSIVCVETSYPSRYNTLHFLVSMPHAALCVSRRKL